jgi:dTDP-4-amino-4,6-dideoxygalactose transaminase
MDVSKVKAAITPKTKAIMPVHYAGQPVDMDALLKVAGDIPIVEDACQSIDAEFNGRRCGATGIAGGFSLHPLKNLNVWSDGGVIVTNSVEMRDKLHLLRNHGMTNRDEYAFYGYNSRLDSVQAAVGNILIKDTKWITERRIEAARFYDESLKDLSPQVTLPMRSKNERNVYHLYMMLVDERDALLKHLNDSGIEAKVHYPIPLHLQPASKHLGYKLGDFPVAEAQAKRLITLPVHQHLTGEELNYVVTEIRKFYRK